MSKRRGRQRTSGSKNGQYGSVPPSDAPSPRAGGNGRAPRRRDEEITLHDLLALSRRHWKGAAAIFTVVMAAAAAYIALSPPAFTSTGALYIDNPRSGGMGEGLGGLMPVMGLENNIESQKELLASADLAVRVIEELGLNAKLEGPPEHLPARPRFWRWRLEARDVNLYTGGLRVGSVAFEEPPHAPREHTVRFTGGGGFELLDAAGEVEARGELGEPVEVGGASFVLGGRLAEPIPSGTRFTLTVLPPQLVLEGFLNALRVEGGGRGPGRASDLVRVSFVAGSPHLAPRVVESISEQFIALKHDWATSVSRATIDFVDSQLEGLRGDLERSADQLADFQKESGVLHLEPQVEAELERLVSAEVGLRQAEIRRGQLERLVGGIDGEHPEPMLFAHLDNPAIQELAESLSRLNMEISGLESRFQESYPPLRERRATRRKLLDELRGAVAHFADRTREAREEQAAIVAEARERFARLPESARTLAELERSARLHENLYLFLLREQQKARVAEAATLSNIQIVDRPMLPLIESAPRARRTLAIGMALSVFAAVGYIFLQAMRTSWFTTADEVREAAARPVFAMVPFRGRRARRGSPGMLVHNPQSSFVEAIRQLRTNLLHSTAGKPHQVVMVTSSMPGEGKTTIAANLACGLVRSERAGRVLLIDADMHKPSLHGLFECPASPGLSDYLNGRATLERIVRTVELPGGGELDVICAGPVPPSPVELTETQAMRELLAHAQEHYAFAILDSPPYPLVTSGLVLAEKVDRILSVCLLGSTNRQAFRRHVEDLGAVNAHLGVVINAADSDGGYGYGYSYAGYGANGHSGRLFGRLWNQVARVPRR